MWHGKRLFFINEIWLAICLSLFFSSFCHSHAPENALCAKKQAHKTSEKQTRKPFITLETFCEEFLPFPFLLMFFLICFHDSTNNDISENLCVLRMQLQNKRPERVDLEIKQILWSYLLHNY